MGQRNFVFLILLLITTIGCDNNEVHKPQSRPDGIVSLSPAATDLLVHLGLYDRIVGVSSYEANASLKSRLPVVGDYQRIDWETLVVIRPRYLIVQGRSDRMPPGLSERCQSLGIQLIDIQIDRLDDILMMLVRLAQALGVEQTGLNAARKVQIQMDTVIPSGKIPALILLNESGKFSAGKQTFLDDLLTRAGGENVITTSGYPTLDREFLATLAPQIVFVLLPGADDKTVDQARQMVDQIRFSGQSKKTRIRVIRRPDVLLPSCTNAIQLFREMSDEIREKGLQK
ncbi:MAG: hypothetical protein KatS3mg104_3218 [Phycisphaerae bacterium]|jgi:ABC-type hemin transport system substrate-binding protein|nr:MAG: hypothetical protein KatS3mg104_3218 [Phycisphaerae bacterium]